MSLENTTINNEKYLSARLLEKFCLTQGEKGAFLINVYRYLRIVDDHVDQPIDEDTNGFEYVSRQQDILLGKSLPNLDCLEEVILSSLNWGILGGLEDRARFQVNMLLESIKDDAIHEGLLPRNNREIRHYNWRTLYPAVNLVGIVINGREIQPTSDFMTLLNAWNKLGSLLDFEEDLSKGQLKLPLVGDDLRSALSTGDLAQRLGVIHNVYNQNLLRKETQKALLDVVINSGSFFDVNIEKWQQLVSFVYMTVRVPTKVIFRQFHLSK